MKYRSDNRQEPTRVQIGVCMNCIVMQQALTMANTALKGKINNSESIFFKLLILSRLI